MSTANDQGNCKETAKQIIIDGVITVSLLAGIIIGGYGTLNAATALDKGNPAVARPYTNLLSIGATLLLVGLTGWYVRETRKMRIEESLYQREERRRREDNVRRAFLTEIKAVENLDSYLDEYTVDQIARMRRVVPTAMYENHCDKLGLLDRDEVRYIADYYATAQSIEDLSYSHRTGNDASDQIEEKFDDIANYKNNAITELEDNLDTEE